MAKVCWAATLLAAALVLVALLYGRAYGEQAFSVAVSTGLRAAGLSQPLQPFIPRLPRRHIPRTVHQTWKSSDRDALPAWAQAHSRTWEAKNPGWKHTLWGDDDIDAHIATHHPELLSASRKMQPVQRSDLFRYMILYDEGGVYADLDVSCLIPCDAWARAYGRFGDAAKYGDPGLIVGFEQISSERTDWADWYAREFQFAQWTMAAQPGHPVLKEVLTLIHRFFAGDPELTHTARGNWTVADVLESTGPGIWTDAIVRYMRSAYNQTLRDGSAADGGKRRLETRGIALLSKNALRNPHSVSPARSEIRPPARVAPGDASWTYAPHGAARVPELPHDRRYGLGLEIDVLILPARAFGFGGGGVRIEGGFHPPQDQKRDVLVSHHFQGSWKAGKTHSTTGATMSWKEAQGRAPEQREGAWPEGKCRAFRQTSGCRGDGPRESERDGPCNRQVTNGVSGCVLSPLPSPSQSRAADLTHGTARTYPSLPAHRVCSYCECHRDGATVRVLFACDHPLFTCVAVCEDRDQL